MRTAAHRVKNVFPRFFTPTERNLVFFARRELQTDELATYYASGAIRASGILSTETT